MSLVSVCVCFSSNLSIPLSLYNQNVGLMFLVYDFLELWVEVVDLVVIISGDSPCFHALEIQPHTHICHSIY